MILLCFCAFVVSILAVDNYEHEQYEVNYYVNDDDFDPKEYFFRSTRAYEQIDDDYLDAPKPGGLYTYSDEKKNADDKNKENRNKRDVDSLNETINSTDVPQEEKALEKPLELGNFDPENVTAVPPEIIQLPQEVPHDFRTDKIEINDFIRFKRELELQKANASHARSGKMLLAPDDIIYSGNREPRGAIKDQWIKQPYPVQSKSETSYEDVSPSATESVRAPRVHFVTQRRSESSASPVYRQYNFEANRNYKDSPRDAPRDAPRDSPRDSPAPRDFYVRQSRHYDPYPQPPSYYENRRDPYYRFDDFRRYEQKYEPVDRDEGYNKHRRIIYYATLPEIVRSPPNVDLRDRYTYRDRFDDRYVTSRPLSVSSDPYRYRKGYPISKARYEENDRTKVPYPLKVSTDVNVREIKKNPERRIYSEADQRYAYKAPSYHPENAYDRRQ